MYRIVFLAFVFASQFYYIAAESRREIRPMKCYFVTITATNYYHSTNREPDKNAIQNIIPYLTKCNNFNVFATCNNARMELNNKTFSKGLENSMDQLPVNKNSTLKIWYSVNSEYLGGDNDILEAYKCKENALHRTGESYTEIQELLKFRSGSKPFLLVDSHPCCKDPFEPCCQSGYIYYWGNDTCVEEIATEPNIDKMQNEEKWDSCRQNLSAGILIIISSGSFVVLVAVVLASIYIWKRRYKRPISEENETGEREETPEDNVTPGNEIIQVTTTEAFSQCPTPPPLTPSARDSLSGKSEVYMNMEKGKARSTSLSSSNGRPMSRSEISFDFKKHIPLENIKFTEIILGRGQFGQVELVEAKIGETTLQCAAKMIRGRGTPQDERELFEELQTLYSISSHKNVVGLLGACIDNSCPLYVLVEYCPKGNLLKYLQKHKSGNEYINVNIPILDFRWKLKRAIEICNGMKFLEQNKIIHRDLATRNILLDVNEKAKIADFGMAKDVYLRGLYIKETAGFLPVRWMAIESIESNIYTIKSDMWSFGILLWELYMDGQLPYPGVINGAKLLAHLLKGYRMNQPEHCPDEFYQLMEKCWLKNPGDRPQFVQARRKLKDIMRQETRKESSTSNESDVSDDRSCKDQQETRENRGNFGIENYGRSTSKGDIELQTIVESPPDHNTKL